LKAIVKDGGRAENRRVWKLRVYEENTVAPSLRKAVGGRSLKRCGPTHSSGGAHALYHSIKHDTRSFSSSGALLTFYDVQQMKVTGGVETTHLITSDILVYLVFDQVKVLPHILW
jgi:hypothetical protein